jgi:5-methyltetrahydrofolate--homocysteine methyltransferase
MTELSGTYEELASAIEMGEEDDARALARQAVDEGHEPADIIKTAMSEGVKRAGERFNNGEFFLPELMLTGEAMKAGLSVVMPIILEQMKDSPIESKGKIMMGTVEGDVHDIGKNICLAMLQAQGFEVVDLGVDNDEDWIIEQVKRERPNALGLGSYMTTTMVNIPPVFERIRREGLDKELNLKLLAGGVALNRRWALEVAKADNYADDAWELIDMLHAELGIEQQETKGSEYGRGENVKIR